MTPTTIAELWARRFDIPMNEPFGIATGQQTVARNVLVGVKLRDGTEGLGEAAPFPAVNGETQDQVLGAVPLLREAVAGSDAREWARLATRARQTAAPASARCAVEMAVLDALGRHYRMPLWALFGGGRLQLSTDITVVTGSTAAAEAAAARAVREGFSVLKVKVGGAPLEHDLERLAAIVRAAPKARLVLDANGSLDVDGACRLIERARSTGSRIALFEQPTPGDDLASLAAVAARIEVPVAADESATSSADVAAVAGRSAASVINLKIMKSGIVESIAMAHTARAHGLGLMIGGMVESRMAMTTSACLAVSLDIHDWVDLDTPLFLDETGIEGGWRQNGPLIDLSSIEQGHGVLASRACYDGGCGLRR